MGNKLAKTTGSNKLKKRRSQSITWNFRYSTLRKNKNQKNILILQQSESYSYPDIGEWLQLLDLKQYENNFNEFSGIDKLFGYSDEDLQKLGITNLAHRDKIISSLIELREKSERKQIPTESSTTNPEKYATVSKERHSLSIDSTNLKDSNSTLDKENILNRCNSTIESKDSSFIYEALDVVGENNKNKQSKSCGDLLDMDPTTPTSETQESIVIKKALEWELSLDSRDLRSHAWYHGPIQRQRADEILQKDGDFLIRDCASQPGNYVLSCRMKTSVLHFVINKVLVQPETVYERVQYQFEDDAYDTVPDLITFYVGSGKPISIASGARIQFPCNRIYPLSFYGNKITSSHNPILGSGIRVGVTLQNSPTLNSPGQFNRFNPYTQQQQQGNYNNIHHQHRSPMSSPPRTKRETPPRLPSKKQRSHSLTPVEAVISGQNPDKYCSADGVIQHNDNNRSGPIENLITDTIVESKLSNGQQNSANDLCKRADNNGKENENNTKVLSSRTITTEQRNNMKLFSNSIPRSVPGNYRSTSRQSSLNRDTNNETSINRSIESNINNTDANATQNKPPSPPPKPARTPSNANQLKRENFKELPLEQQQHALNRVASYHASGSDSGNGSGDSSAACDLEITTPHRGVIIKNPRFMPYSASSMTLKSFSDFDVIAAEQKLANMNIPVLEQISIFDLENFQTLLLPSVDNKPLDNGALNTFRVMLAENGPRIIAQHITRIDIKLILGDLEENEPISDNILDRISGIELLTLPHGKMFRNDLIERTQCLKLLVAITILTCQSDLERAETLDKWIQVAVETKNALGNLFGFCAIMLGLCMTQIQRLDQTWHILRQKYTDSAFTFEAKLRPTLKSMNDCTNPQAPNTTIPHLLPYVLLKDRNISDTSTVPTTTSASINIQQSLLITTCISSWETNADDFGISILFAHLDSARFFTKNLSLYKQNGLIVFKNSNSRLDELLSDSFRTEFHIKFLWGSKGSTVSSEDRHAKLEHVLELMAEKFCLND